MTVEEISLLLIQLLDDFESLGIENRALKAVMRTAVLRDPKEVSLREQVARLLEDPSISPILAPIHAHFDEMRRQIRQAIQDQNLAELADAIASARGRLN